jgi:hypothetical protein
MRLKLPAVRIATTYVAEEACGLCRRDWDNRRPVPTAYVESTLGGAGAGDDAQPPVPVCDFCVEQHSPVLFDALLRERRRFHGT